MWGRQGGRLGRYNAWDTGRASLAVVEPLFKGVCECFEQVRLHYHLWTRSSLFVNMETDFSVEIIIVLWGEKFFYGHLFKRRVLFSSMESTWSSSSKTFSMKVDGWTEINCFQLEVVFNFFDKEWGNLIFIVFGRWWSGQEIWYGVVVLVIMYLLLVEFEREFSQSQSPPC